MYLRIDGFQLSETSRVALKFLDGISAIDQEFRTKTALLLGASHPVGNKKIYFYSPVELFSKSLYSIHFSFRTAVSQMFH